MAHRVEIALSHQNAIVGPDQHATERMMPMRRRFARDSVGGPEVSKHLIASHGKIL